MSTDLIPVPLGSLKGPQGERGPAGTDAVQPLVFSQDMPSATWVIPHSFSYSPSVTVIDSTGEEVGMEISHTPGVVTARADLPFSGRALLI